MQMPHEQMVRAYAVQGANPYAKQPWSSGDIGTLVIGLLAPLLLWLAFSGGHGAIDQPRPDAALGQTWYIAAVVLGLMALGGVAVLGMERFAVRGGIALAVAVPFGFVIALTGQDYGYFGGFFFTLFNPVFWILMALGIAHLTVVLVLAVSQGGRAGADAAAIGGVGMALGLSGAALYHLVTLEQQVAAAQAAYADTPAPAMVLVALLMLAVAWRRR